VTPSTLDRVTRVIVEATGTNPGEPLHEDTSLVGAGLALDSVAVVELLVGLEKEFHAEITPDELLQAQAFKTIGTLVRFMDAKCHPARPGDAAASPVT